MVSENPSFEDQIAVVSAELKELAKRPISKDTYSELVALRERLEGVVSDFIMCEGCDEMFPIAVQVTIGGDTATLCKDCAITSIQKDSFTTPRKGRKGSGASKRSRKQVPDNDESALNGAAGSSDADESAPSTVSATPRARSRSRSRTAKAAAPEGEDESTSGGSGSLQPSGTTNTSEYVTARRPNSGPLKIEQSDSKTSVDDVLSAPRSRAARLPQSDEPVLKATFKETASHLDRTTNEVRQVGRLVEEISPPMDVEKTTRYVMAELRNQRSKIPVSVIPKIVKLLKNGLPSKENGNGGK
jgi:hypothetical protein